MCELTGYKLKEIQRQWTGFVPVCVKCQMKHIGAIWKRVCKLYITILYYLIFFNMSMLCSFQKEIDNAQYGPSLADVERQIAEHNLLQRQIDEYGTEIRNLPQVVIPKYYILQNITPA